MISEPLFTINGSLALDCDSLASLLSQRIDYLSLYGPLSEALENNHFWESNVENSRECQLEVEIRLGYVQNVRSEQRFSLPLTTDTLLSNRAPVKFIAGVSEEQYNSCKNLILENVNNGESKEEWVTKLNSYTINRFFEIPGYDELVRISVPIDDASNKGTKENGYECIRKVNLLKWNVSSGSNQNNEESEEYLVEESLDYRIAINLEYRVPLVNLPTTSNAKHCRRRLRDSFINNPGKVRFDISKVEDLTESRSNKPQSATFEVEIELVGDEIIRCLKDTTVSSEDRMNKLKYHCSTLIRSARYIRDFLSNKSESLKYCSFISSISDKVGLYDLRIASQDDQSVIRYKANLSAQIPLIGDYMYRTVSHDIENNPDLYKGRKSLYSEHLGNIPGPFSVKLDENGRKIVTDA